MKQGGRTTRPVIGVTLDSEQPDAASYSRYPWYALRANYMDSLVQADGLPVALPHHAALADAMLDRIDALVVTGGAFDIDPGLYGDGALHETVVLKQDRTAAELALVRGALARDMPVLGICGGQQLLAVALGGRLIQHVPDEVPDGLQHEQPNPRHEAGHDIEILPDTLLHRIVGSKTMRVNSAHHQAVREPGLGIASMRWRRTGSSRAIEDPSRRFCLGRAMASGVPDRPRRCAACSAALVAAPRGP
nr:gamma-glutamyl-gamma-aminobutyrate hydrolase family protein [uncultured Lichenicoccus sp.]